MYINELFVYMIAENAIANKYKSHLKVIAYIHGVK